jgi:hypothetical protein
MKLKPSMLVISEAISNPIQTRPIDMRIMVGISIDDRGAGNGRYHNLFEETEFSVPNHGNAREDGGEEEGHPDYARKYIGLITLCAGQFQAPHATAEN